MAHAGEVVLLSWLPPTKGRGHKNFAAMGPTFGQWDSTVRQRVVLASDETQLPAPFPPLLVLSLISGKKYTAHQAAGVVTESKARHRRSRSSRCVAWFFDGMKRTESSLRTPGLSRKKGKKLFCESFQVWFSYSPPKICPRKGTRSLELACLFISSVSLQLSHPEKFLYIGETRRSCQEILGIGSYGP
jgi:hypothetical protein